VKLKANLSTQVKNLGVGNQQLVEIAKALSRNVQLLILDEPTAALNEDDSQNLLLLLKELKKQGVTCIMVSHKLKEVNAIADTITVLRDGSTICSLDATKGPVSERVIIKNMVGREIENIYPKREKVEIGDICFQIDHWTVEDPEKGRNILDDVSLHVCKGEIVGLQGLMGAGRTELALSVFGNFPHYRIKSGTLALEGEPISFASPRDAINAGVAYVSEDRKGNGLILIQDIKYNITLANLKKITHGFAINENEEIMAANEFKDSINIKTPSVQQTVGNLSGGNQQKVQVAKWMYVHPKVLILDEPTRGIDVGAKYEIYTLMNQLVESGMSILMISSELSEILGMSDRLYVMSEGKIAGELSGEEASEEAVMILATNS
jgi:putative multiple sugar transport system ATP-binding protein